MKFWMNENEVFVLIKSYRKKLCEFPELHFNFEYKNNLVLKKLENFYSSIEITETLKLINFENLVSKCVIVEFDNERIATEVVSIDEHD